MWPQDVSTSLLPVQHRRAENEDLPVGFVRPPNTGIRVCIEVGPVVQGLLRGLNEFVWMRREIRNYITMGSNLNA